MREAQPHRILARNNYELRIINYELERSDLTSANLIRTIIQGDETFIQALAEALGTSAQTPEAAHEVKPPEIDTEVPSTVPDSDVISGSVKHL